MAPRNPEMQVVCAWCGRVEKRPVPRSRVSGPAPAAPITHTICGECFKRERAELERVVRARRKTGA